VKADREPVYESVDLFLGVRDLCLYESIDLVPIDL
jgi:hypothetical protein